VEKANKLQARRLKVGREAVMMEYVKPDHRSFFPAVTSDSTFEFDQSHHIRISLLEVNLTKEETFHPLRVTQSGPRLSADVELVDVVQHACGEWQTLNLPKHPPTATLLFKS